MGDDMPRLSTDELLAHVASVRALASHLLGDAHLGEDVAQETAVVALTQPPAPGARIGPWLRGVARHLSIRRIRTDARRRRREEHAARGEASAAGEDVVERTEMRQLVVAELLALEEPYRRTLLLRYFEDLEPTEIARRDGVPAGTVRSRVKRGLDLLRARLDARSGGERRAWTLPLAGLLGGPGGAALPSVLRPRTAAVPVPLTVGALFMSVKAIAAAVLVLVIGGVAWFATREVGDDVPSGTPSSTTAAVGPTGTPAGARPRAEKPDAAAGSETPAVATPAAIHADVWVTGRVVGEGRHPVADVDVALVTSFSDAVHARTGPDGRFRTPATLPPRADRGEADFTDSWATLHARAADGRAAFGTVVLHASETGIDAPTLVLGAAHRLEVAVRSGDAPAAGVRVNVAGRVRAVSDAAGIARFDAVPDGSYIVEAGDPARGHAFATASVPRAEGPVVLVLTQRAIVVTVVRERTGEPVAGERVGVWFRCDVPGMGLMSGNYDPRLGTAPTAADGTTTIHGVGRDEHVLIALTGRSASTPGGSPQMQIACKPGDTSVRIELPSPRTYRFRIVPGEVAPPPEGAVLALVPWGNAGVPAPEKTAVVRNGEVVVETPAGERMVCLARAADGSLARLHWIPPAPEVQDTKFHAERRIEVFARDADGRPLRGVPFVVRDQGGNAMVPAVPTDETGVARISGLYGGLADVVVLTDIRSKYGGSQIGTVDLEKGSGRVEYTRPREIRVVLRIRVSAEPALPTRFSLSGARVTAEDPDAGTLDLAITPASAGAAAKLGLVADGFQRRVIDVPAGAADGLVIAVDLVRGGTLKARVVPAADGRARVLLQRWNDAGARWEGTPAGPDGSVRPDATGAVVLESLIPGRYRLMDGASYAVGAPADVAEGGTADCGTFDLSRSGWARGHVVVPQGASLSGARIVVEGDGVAPPAPGPDVAQAGVGRDGTFMVRVPGDRTVRVRVDHPTLRTSAAGGVADVTLPRDGVELRLERGPVATLRAQTVINARSLGGVARVLVYADEPSGAPLAELAPLVEEGALRFGLPGTGTRTLWIDARPWAPLVLRGVTFGDGDVDLGTQQFASGSSIRVKLLVKSGQAAPRIAIWASAEGAPSYTRGVNSNGESEVVLRGLGTGTFKVQLMQIMDMGGSPPPPARTVEMDGADGTESVIEWDVR